MRPLEIFKNSTKVQQVSHGWRRRVKIEHTAPPSYSLENKINANILAT